jgi:hypothetical protein
MVSGHSRPDCPGDHSVRRSDGHQGKTDKAAPPPSSYSPVVIKEDFATTLERMKKDKSQVMNRQLELLKKRYDLDNKPAKGVVMTRGKAVQENVRVKLSQRHDLGQAGRHDPGGDQGKGPVAGGLFAAAPPQPS